MGKWVWLMAKLVNGDLKAMIRQ
jgi:hypothetical protein